MKDKNQEDIDQTLNENNETLAQNDIDTIGEIGNIFMGSASTTLSVLLKNKVEITTPLVEVFDSIEECNVIKNDYVMVEINYTEGLGGKVILALKQQDAAIMADLLMEGSGKPATSELDEMKISAVEEAMNQMIGTASTAMSGMLNMKIIMSPPKISLSEKTKKAEINKDLINGAIISTKFNFKVGELISSELIQLISVASAKLQILKITENIKNMTDNLKDISSQSIVDSFIMEEKHQNDHNFNETSSLNPNEEAFNRAFAQQQAQQQNQVMVQPVQFASFDKTQHLSGSMNQNLNLVMDVTLGLTVELGRAELPIKNILELTRGSIIELDKIAGEPVELYANGKLIAKGEVVVIEDNFGLRITNIISPEQRLKHL
ncbi:MAG TPA: flagellar motor switch phosphatase FliY [Candidatus Gastranaerophilales bacterium]|nr:flagellar motor switch phosphatase FliY [Candidatus Gastranaerophilales bacterium]